MGLPSCRRVMQGCAMPLLLLSLFFLLTGRLLAQDNPALNTKIKYKAVNQPLATVLKEIRTISGVRFTYNTDQVKKAPAVTVDQQSGTLKQLLERVLSNSGLDFAEYFGGILIYPDKPKANPDKRLSFPVRGRVVDAANNPLGGATIQVVGTQDGSVTLPDGLFSLLMQEHQQLRVSMLGMKTTIRTVTMNEASDNLVVIRLDTAAQAIQEVVVNGYQKIDARMSTASVFKLNAADIIQPGVSSLDKMLQGKVPGLMIINTTGSVNGRPTIRMRGTSTFVGNPSPLWVIDNVVRPDPVDISTTQLNNVLSDAQTGNFSLVGNAISGINPYDIESITFLRDAAATAIYGVRAANGVIVVTTKRGKAGPMQISYNTSYSFQQRPSYRNLNLMNSQQRVQLSQEMHEDGLALNSYDGLKESISYEGLLQALYAREITETQFKVAVTKLGAQNTDWFKVLFRNAFSMNHSLQIDGGAGKTTYHGSISYNDNRGAAQLDGNKNYTANLSLHTEAGKRLSFDFNLMANYSQMRGYFSGVSVLSYALQTSRILDPNIVYPVRPADIGFSALPFPPPITFNMVNDLTQSENTNSKGSLLTSLTLNYKIMSGLYFQNVSSVITDAVESMSAAYEGSRYISQIRGWPLDYVPTDKQIAISNLPYGGIANLANQNVLTYSTRNMLTYNASFFNNRDQFIVSGGTEISSSQIKGQSSVEPGYYPDRGMSFYPDSKSLFLQSKHSLTRTTNNTLGMFGTATYSMNNKYVLGGTIRTDGSNRFGQYSNAKFLPNYGLSARWSVGNESWLQTSRLISGLDLRATFGTQGNVVTAVGPELIATYSPVGTDINPATGIPLLGIKSLPYPYLRWEKTAQWNFGIDLSLFDRRVNVSGDYYLKRSKDLIATKVLPYEYGVDVMYKNAGRLLNRGVDFHLSVEVIRRKNTNLIIAFNNSKNFNEVGPNDFQNDFSAYLNGQAFIPGKPISGFYSYKYTGLSPVNGTPTFSNLNGKTYMEGDPSTYLVYSGQMQPVITGGVSPTFRYKNFSASMLLFYSLGGHKRLNTLNPQVAGTASVPNPFVNVNKALLDRWRKPGDENRTNIPAIVDQTTNTAIPDFPDNLYSAYDKSDYRVVSNNFIRCKQLSFSYLLPKPLVTKIGVKNISAGLFVYNLFTIANKALQGQDPEIDGVGTSALPLTRQYGFNMNVIF
ncbi:TonB-linked SusC/RagA family outer membrane protein [Chitinophaga dinghuensis]|uniref:TonB-linked SusC/RagA family outer membrane protein n=2 Tax=Chitinophaga dinghuensis TaxID=1539050 RepID=A0A327W593_9BACT|nr:TonB-linked SusC/RagA family outer membrane protein [Chitinophaga dinghuensis]